MVCLEVGSYLNHQAEPDLRLVCSVCLSIRWCLPLSDFLRIMLLLRDNSLRAYSRAWRSPVDILSFGLSNSILASSNFTSSRKVSRATDSWTGGSQSDFTWKG